MTSIYYNNRYIAAGHSFDTTRKSGLLAADLLSNPVPGVTIKSPVSLTERDLMRAHDPQYINAVRTGFPERLAASQGFRWDSGLWTGVCASNGGIVAATLEAMRTGQNTGSLSSGLHHARYEGGMGFCTFNGLALAALAARRQKKDARVLLIDADAHCGGGTNSILKHCNWVDSIDISTSGLDTYQADNVRWSMDIVSNPRNYLSTLQFRLDELDQFGYKYDVLIYNAGMDCEERCFIGGLDGLSADIIADRERKVYAWAHQRKMPVAFTLAGGYSGSKLPEGELTKLHRLTVEAAAGVL